MSGKLPTAPHQIKKILQKLDMQPRKRFGQNFLLDSKWQKELAIQADLSEQEVVLEIGPGLGHLTQCLVEYADTMWCVEIDKKLADFVAERFCNYHLQVLNFDILAGKNKINEQILEIIGPVIEKRPYKVLSNLPYSVATPIIMNFLELSPPPKNMVITVQKEVAQRLIAEPGTSDYGYLSLHAQLHAKLEIVGKIPPSAFYPKPKIDSAMVKIIPAPPPAEIMDKKLLLELIKTSFQMRRKTLWNIFRHKPSVSLESSEWKKALHAANIAPERRGESLSLQEYINLANCVYDLMSNL